MTPLIVLNPRPLLSRQSLPCLLPLLPLRRPSASARPDHCLVFDVSAVLSVTYLDLVLSVDNSSANIPASAAPGVTTSRPPLVPLSPPMTPEDLQTMPIPDDLFRYEPPKPSSQEAVLVRATPSPSPSVAERRTAFPSRGRGPRRRDEPRNVPQSPATPSPSTTGDETPHRGNGVACRFFFGLGMKKGCKRGNECAFSHVPVPPRPSHTARRNALEEELARKNLGRSPFFIISWKSAYLPLIRT